MDTATVRPFTTLQRWALLWAQPAWSFLFATLLFALMAWLGGRMPWGTSQHAYYNYLADAFVHGQLHLRLLPPLTNDLISFGNRYYLYWSPFPAVLLMPFVALFGVGFSDVLFTLVVGGINVSLIAAILQAGTQRGLFQLSPLQRALLVIFFTVGTVHLALPYGAVWFTGQVVAFCSVALAYWAALRLRGVSAFVVTGLAMACTLATRNHAIFAGIWPAYFLLRQHWGQGKRLIGWAALGVAPVLVAGGLLAAYNLARFGNVAEVGLPQHLMANVFRTDYERYGVFNVHYIPTNLYYQYIFYPFPLRDESWMGGSLFLLSPVFLAALWALWVERRQANTWVLLVTILAVNVPILLLMGTGWLQFGPRYTLDFTVPLMLLTALGVQYWRPAVVAGLSLISFVQYSAGTLTLLRMQGPG